MDRTYSEITRQYDMLDRTIRYFEQQKAALKDFYQKKKPESIAFVGSGSSYYIAQSAEIIARTHYGIPAFSITSGDGMVNFGSNKRSFKNVMAVAISRSGNTTEILNVVQTMRRNLAIPIIGITCVEDSGLCKIADLCLQMPWTFDESVCQTGTVSNLYAAAALLLASFAGDDQTFADLKKMTAAGNRFLSENDPPLQAIVEQGRGAGGRRNFRTCNGRRSRVQGDLLHRFKLLPCPRRKTWTDGPDRSEHARHRGPETRQ